jgi:hypothetical protein
MLSKDLRVIIYLENCTPYWTLLKLTQLPPINFFTCCYPRNHTSPSLERWTRCVTLSMELLRYCFFIIAELHFMCSIFSCRFNVGMFHLPEYLHRRLMTFGAQKFAGWIQFTNAYVQYNRHRYYDQSTPVSKLLKPPGSCFVPPSGAVRLRHHGERAIVTKLHAFKVTAKSKPK